MIQCHVYQYVCSGHCLVLLLGLLLLTNSDWSTYVCGRLHFTFGLRAGGNKVISHWSGKIQAVCEASSCYGGLEVCHPGFCSEFDFSSQLKIH